jgi:hypothetical protein
MKSLLVILVLIACLSISSGLYAQCAVCTKTAGQMGEDPARGLNAGILYLAFTPIAIIGIVGYRWWRQNKA